VVAERRASARHVDPDRRRTSVMAADDPTANTVVSSAAVM
jgi:hypothetical protein